MRHINRIREELEAAALRFAITGEVGRLREISKELHEHHLEAQKLAETEQTADFSPLDPRAVSFAA